MSNIKSSAQPRKRFRRVLWVAIILAFMALYFPINRFAQGGAQLSTALDRVIPLYSFFIIPYLLGSLLFVALPVWAAAYSKSGDFESYVITLLLATAVSYIIYLTFPTYVSRPLIVSDDPLSRAISILYQADLAYNAAPSGHAYYSTISLWYLIHWKPQYRPICWLFWLIILASTLFTRQHNILDLVSGIALASIACMAGSYLQRKRALKFAS